MKTATRLILKNAVEPKKAEEAKEPERVAADDVFTTRVNVPFSPTPFLSGSFVSFGGSSAVFRLLRSLLAAALVAVASAQTPIMPEELVAPKVEISGGTIKFTVQPSVPDRRYQLQGSGTMAAGTWINLGPEQIGDGNDLVLTTPRDPGAPQHFYWLVLDQPRPDLNGFSYIPAGSFQMGDQSDPLIGNDPVLHHEAELPVHSVFVSGFYMGRTEVTMAQWDETYFWARSNGYQFDNRGSGKAGNHPVHTLYWFDICKWCNAGSEQQGLQPCYTVGGEIYKTGQEEAPDCDFTKNGYRLPTEAEWEKAARGGLIAKNFPWGDTISHSQANYYVWSQDGVTNFYSYDISPTQEFHPIYSADDIFPATSPVGSFAANGYGLYDMAGNVWERCWDRYEKPYPATPQNDPHGPASGEDRVVRGGEWGSWAISCRVAHRLGDFLTDNFPGAIGFRVARSAVHKGAAWKASGMLRAHNLYGRSGRRIEWIAQVAHLDLLSKLDFCALCSRLWKVGLRSALEDGRCVPPPVNCADSL